MINASRDSFIYSRRPFASPVGAPIVRTVSAPRDSAGSRCLLDITTLFYIRCQPAACPNVDITYAHPPSSFLFLKLTPTIDLLPSRIEDRRVALCE